MRSRNLKPGFFTNELLGTADLLYGVLFEGLWCMADREGRLEDRPLRMCAQLFPYRRNVTERKVDKALTWLDENRFIKRYEAAGRRYIQIIEFLKHQNPHKNEAPSKIQALTSIKHSAARVQSTVQEQESDGPKTEAAQDMARSAPASSLIPDSLIPDSQSTATRSKEGAGPVRNGDHWQPADAWRDITECDPEAYATWLEWRAEANDVVPPMTRIRDAKFLGGKGSPAEQRAFVDELIRLRFKRLHDPITNGRSPAAGQKSFDQQMADLDADLGKEGAG